MKIIKYGLIIIIYLSTLNAFSQTIKKDSISIYKDFGGSDICLKYSNKSITLNKSQKLKLISFINKIKILDDTLKVNLFIRLTPFNDYKNKIGILRAKNISDYIVKNKVIERYKILILERTDSEGEGQNLLCIEARLE